jgi:thiamine biosynthesis lipoprotein
VTEACSRFEPDSELVKLSGRIGEPVPVSALLYEAVRFALTVADESEGAFDPTVGHRMETLGFDHEFRSGRVSRVAIDADDNVSYRDVILGEEQRTIMLRHPLVLDLGAVAKGLAVDMAARELQPFGDFAIDAGGDLYLGGHNAQGGPWAVGIRHPRDPRALAETLHVSNAAVCTSGDYERRRPTAIDAHHILDPRADLPATRLASVTVVAPTAMVADALSTAAFVLGPVEGIAFLERHGVSGFMLTPSLERFATRDMGTAFLFARPAPVRAD